MDSTDFKWAMVFLFFTRGKRKVRVVSHSSVSVCALDKCKAELAVAKTPATPNLDPLFLVILANNRNATME